jgi:SAM-dependent methyltransferase
MNANPVYISEDRTVHTGPEAAALLAVKNDAAHVDPEAGIVRATRERWLEAQRYERKTWMADFRGATDDRNLVHAGHFDGYAALDGERFTRAIELGCGPFTNLRHVAARCEIAAADLLDPLLNDYLSHPHCAYAGGRLDAPGKPGLAVSTHACAIEDFRPAGEYDLIVMINVLEHCFDAGAIFRRITEMASPDAVFVFHDRCYAAADLSQSLRGEYDAGHPLRIDRRVIDGFLSDHFTARFSRTVRFERHKWGADRSYDGLYFIGSRRA